MNINETMVTIMAIGDVTAMMVKLLRLMMAIDGCCRFMMAVG